jgi:uncharacterized protein YndB with AHSA1/START domain
MAPQRYEVDLRSAGPPEVVFDLLVDRSRWPQWAGAMIRWSTWEREGVPAPGGVGAIGQLGSPRLHTREEIIEYDRPRHLAYTILSGIPVRGYRADVSLTPDGDGTRIHWAGSFEPKVPGTGALLRLMLGGTIRGVAKRLAAEAAKS